MHETLQTAPEASALPEVLVIDPARAAEHEMVGGVADRIFTWKLTNR